MAGTSCSRGGDRARRHHGQHNIILIDTYNEKRGLALRTSAQRRRPVMLTAVTTVLGLMPMVLRVNVDLFAREITFGGPSTGWWAQLASAIACGLTFATLLTLVPTPALLLLGARAARWFGARRAEASANAGRRALAPQPAEQDRAGTGEPSLR